MIPSHSIRRGPIALTAAFFALIALAGPISARQSTPTIAGKWRLAMATPHGEMTVTLELALKGTKVSGAMVSEQFGRLPLSGEYVDAKLVFAVSSDNGDLEFTGKLKDKDTLTGDMSGHAGDMPCTAKRIVEK